LGSVSPSRLVAEDRCSLGSVPVRSLDVARGFPDRRVFHVARWRIGEHESPDPAARRRARVCLQRRASRSAFGDLDTSQAFAGGRYGKIAASGQIASAKPLVIERDEEFVAPNGTAFKPSGDSEEYCLLSRANKPIDHGAEFFAVPYRRLGFNFHGYNPR
jgi:hypothetical protein